MRKTTLILVLLIFSFFSATAQETEWYINKPIVDIEFIGLLNVSPGELDGIKTQYIGKTFTVALYLDMQSKLFALNYFENFDASVIPGDQTSSSVIVQFNVKERPLVDELVFRGNNQLRNRELEEVIITKQDDIVNKARIRIDASAIRDLYISKGFPDAEVTGNTEPVEESNKVIVVFEINEGNQTKVKEILFSGNSFASSSTLKRVLSTKQQTLFSSGIFEEGKLTADKDAILNYYFERGYLDARIVDVVKNVTVDENNQNLLTITFYIEEGVQYTFGGFEFEGNFLFTDEKLKEQVRSEPGKILNKTKLQADMVRITDLYHNDGYIFNEITQEEIRDTEKNELSFIMKIKEYGRAHIENILIQGNTKTKDYVILREIPLEVGDVFSKDKILKGLNNLNNLQFFSSFVPETPQGSAAGLMDLIINVEEGRTIDLNFGVTFTMEAGSLPIAGFVKWTDKNFLGKGQEISVGSEISSRSQTLNFSFNEKWLLGRRWNGGLDFSIKHSLIENVPQDLLYPVFTGTPGDNPQMVPDPYDGHWVNASDGTALTADPTPDEISNGDVITDYAYAIQSGDTIDSAYLMEYHSYDFSLGANTGYSFFTDFGRIGTGTGLSTGLSYTDYDSEIYRPYNPDIRDELNNWVLINKWWARLSYDTRDIIYSPNKGIFLSQSWTYTGGILGGARNYNRSTTIAEAYLKVFEVPVTDTWSWKSVLAFHTNLSLVFQQYARLEDNSWGKTLNAVQSDLLYIDGMVTGKGWPSAYNGRVLWDNWIELRTPLVPGMVSYNWFLSGTGLWTEIEAFQDLALDNFVFSLGTGLQMDIPSFPMGFYFVKRFKYEENQLVWQPGNIFKNENPNSGLDFVLSFTFSYF